MGYTYIEQQSKYLIFSLQLALLAFISFDVPLAICTHIPLNHFCSHKSLLNCQHCIEFVLSDYHSKQMLGKIVFQALKSHMHIPPN